MIHEMNHDQSANSEYILMSTKSHNSIGIDTIAIWFYLPNFKIQTGGAYRF